MGTSGKCCRPTFLKRSIHFLCKLRPETRVAKKKIHAVKVKALLLSNEQQLKQSKANSTLYTFT